MTRTYPVFFAVIVLFFGAANLAPGTTFHGPTLYQSFADSPFSSVTFDYFYLENFEDSSLNTPGVSTSVGIPLNFGTLRDSVDADDGSIDGSGSAGYSWYVTSPSISFTFDDNVLGSYPTHAGMVFTDIGFVLSGTNGISPITFEAFDANNVSLGTIGPTSVGDGVFAGQTDEDRFFGVTHPGGISRISFTVNSDDWELDHVQYGFVEGATVPEPASTVLGLLGAVLGASCKLRRSRIR